MAMRPSASTKSLTRELPTWQPVLTTTYDLKCPLNLNHRARGRPHRQAQPATMEVIILVQQSDAPLHLKPHVRSRRRSLDYSGARPNPASHRSISLSSLIRRSDQP